MSEITTESSQDKIASKDRVLTKAKFALVATAALATVGGVIGFKDSGKKSNETAGDQTKVERTMVGGQPSQTTVVEAPTNSYSGDVDHEPVYAVTPVQTQEDTTQVSEVEVPLSAQAAKVKEYLEKGFKTLDKTPSSTSEHPEYWDLQKITSNLEDCDASITNEPQEATAEYYRNILKKCEAVGAATKELNLRVLNNDIWIANSTMANLHREVALKLSSKDQTFDLQEYMNAQNETIYSIAPNIS